MHPLIPERNIVVFFFSSRRRHTRFDCDWSSDVCSSDLQYRVIAWPCEGVYWVQPITRYCPLGCTYFHRSPRWLESPLSTLASPRKQAENGSLAVRLPAGVQSGRQSNSLLADLTQIVSANLE